MDLVQIVLFEDQYAQQLAPITLTRPAFAIRCGSYRLWDLLQSWERPISCIVRSHLQEIVAADFPQPARLGNGIPDVLAGPALLVNASLVPSVAVLERLRLFVEAKRPAVIRCGNRLAAAYVPKHAAPKLADLTMPRLGRSVAHLPVEEACYELPLFEYPHDVLRHHLNCLEENLEHRIRHGNYQQLFPGVFTAPGVRIPNPWVVDTSKGPIIIDENVSIGPYSYFSGPLYIGANCKILEHSSLKDCTALAHTVKVGGEVEASIIEPYSNKQHHGFLGHSYLGSWVNLGAGTSNSDLKNTYGEVNMDYAGEKVSSGMQFVGCVLGDYAKTAINTSLFTGKLVGAGSMLYGFVTTNVPSFVNYARSFGQQSEIPLEVALSTQARMFARRRVEQRDCDRRLLQAVYEMTQAERLQLTAEPLVL